MKWIAPLDKPCFKSSSVLRQTDVKIVIWNYSVAVMDLTIFLGHKPDEASPGHLKGHDRQQQRNRLQTEMVRSISYDE
jgi:hypothetical protein